LTALRGVLLKNRRLVGKKKLFSFQPTLLFKKLYRGNKEAREAIQGVANFSNYAINGLGLLFFKNNPVCCKPADNILLLLAHEWI